MKLEKVFLSLVVIASFFVFTQCDKDEFTLDEFNQETLKSSALLKKPSGEQTVGNNLSFPVIWAEGIPKTLRTPPGNLVDEVLLQGEWWFVWGPEPIDPQSEIYSCAPSTSDENLCLDQTEPGTDSCGASGKNYGTFHKDPKAPGYLTGKS